jgi:hypothetical protein
MSCASFKSRLNAVLDARRLPQLDLQLCAHVRRCPSCEHLMTTQMLLLEALPSTPAKLSADFAVKILQTAETERRQQHRWRVRATSILAIAAGLMIALASWRGPVLTQGLASHSSAYPATQLTAEVVRRVDQVAADFKPVSGSVYTAFNAIWLANRLL